MRVLLDGRVTGPDGIGRYTRCLTNVLLRVAPRRVDLDIRVLEPTGTPRYSRAEGEELLAAADRVGADLIHLLDFRVPLIEPSAPMVVSIHDILRLTDPVHCYSDDAFAARFGAEGLRELSAVAQVLRGLASGPSTMRNRRPGSLHEEYYARMLDLAVQRAAALITPTRTVYDQLQAWLSKIPWTTISPYGVDHQAESTAGDPDDESEPPVGSYVLYVGQARSHKGIAALASGYANSQARRHGVCLICVGRDFTDGGPGSHLLQEADVLSDAKLLGYVPDRRLSVLYRHARTLVHLADHEGFGFTPVEALFHGTPVVVNDLPVFRETLGPHAIFVAGSEPQQVAWALDQAVLGKRSSREAHQRRAWASRYSWERHALDVIGTYTRVLRT
jgi:glycosyltransferase involved in cell wall biosynthesis